MESVYGNKSNCCGCGACANICPVGAVAMGADEEGFQYPSIDRGRCTDCGACLAVCPLLDESRFKEPAYPRFFAARHRSAEVLKESTSGGAFTAFSDCVLERGGVVYGAAFDGDFRVFHDRAATPAQRDRFRVSKYVQSRTDAAFASALKDLGEGRAVLFTGTPCQTAGLRGLALRKMREIPRNLYCCDVICHSIPSPLIWEDYKRLLEKEHGGKLLDVRFRTKELDWSIKNSDKTFRFLVSGKPGYLGDKRFYDLFFKARTIMRRSCYVCAFTDVRRPSDITVADYWGIEKYMPEFYDPRGVSLVMVNSEKGEALLEAAGRDLILHRRPPEESLAEQPRLSHPTAMPENRDQFWQR